MYGFYTTLGKDSAIEAYSAMLNQVLKDHNDEEAIRITRLSYHNMVRDAVNKEGVQLQMVDTMETDNVSMKPAQLILTSRLDEDVRRELLSGLEKMKFTQLDLKVINEGVNEKGMQYYDYICLWCAKPHPQESEYVYAF